MDSDLTKYRATLTESICKDISSFSTVKHANFISIPNDFSYKITVTPHSTEKIENIKNEIKCELLQIDIISDFEFELLDNEYIEVTIIYKPSEKIKNYLII